jgi:hypothetical protein
VIVSEVATMFRQYIDEPDQTFVTDAMVATMLAQAYREFQWNVMQIDENIYTTNVNITLSSSAVYDLASGANPVRLLGADANLTNPRMSKLVSLATVNGDGTRNTPLVPVTSDGSLSATSNSFYLDGTVLRFAGPLSLTLNLTYFPEPIAGGGAPGSGYIDWTTGTSFIDNLSMFHDVIALLAAKQYAILDTAFNEPLMMQLEQRVRDLKEYLNTRNYSGAQYVSQVRTGHELF